jgi:PAS domain S-box-containing protein
LGRWKSRYYSPVVGQITGRPPEFYLAGPDRWLSTIHPDDQPRMEEAFARLCSGQIAHREDEYRVLRPDGSVRWVRNSVRVSAGSEEGSLHFDGVVADITSRKEAEEKLAHERDLLHVLMANIPHFIYFKDRESRFTHINRAQAENLGITDPHGAIGKTDFDFYPVELAREFYADERRIVETGQPLIDKVERQTGVAETERWLSSTKVPAADKDGRIVGLVGVSRDVTEHQRAEAAVRASEAKYRTLIENLEQCIFLKDEQLHFVAANRNFCARLGVPEAEIVGKTDFDFFPARLAEKYQADDRQVLAEGKRLELEEENLSGGKMHTVRVIKTPVKDDQGRGVAVLGIFWDVTEQRTLEAQLRQSQKMEAVGQLAGGVAHDFNNLLTVILGNVGLLRVGRPLVADERELLAATEKATLRAAELTSKLLGFSRRTAPRLEPTKLNASIEETVSLLRRTIDPRISLVAQPDPACWMVQADPGQMNQVLMNLCLNARDAMPEGGRLFLETGNVVLDEDTVRLQLEARTGEFVRLRVRDTGHGIPPDVLPRIFEPFFTTKDPGKGTGLGLAMVFGIVKQHLGWIDCASTVSEGTRFDIYLPRYIPAQQATADVGVARLPRHGHETILLVDDEAMIRNLGRTILQGYGYYVLLAEDGVQAVETYRRAKGRIDLVILDLTMPRLSGRDAFRQLLQLDPGVRVLFASGYSAEHVTEEERERIQGFVGKPYRPEDLALTVRSTLDKPRK